MDESNAALKSFRACGCIVVKWDSREHGGGGGKPGDYCAAEVN